jgi:hypothetical protein
LNDGEKDAEIEKEKVDRNRMHKQIIGFEKDDNSYNGIAILQRQVEMMAKVMLDQAAWIPIEDREAMADLVETFKRDCEDFKKRVDENLALDESK